MNNKKKLSVKEKNLILANDSKQILNYGVKLSIIPNDRQIEQVNKTFGCSRLAYNKYLSDRRDYFNNTGKTLTVNNYKKDVLNALKQSDDFKFLGEVDKFSLESALEFVDDAYIRFFAKQNKLPKFKCKRKAKKSYTTKYTKTTKGGNIRLDFSNNTLQLPKLGKVKFALPKSKNNLGEFKNLYNKDVKITKVTISKEGKYYFASLCVEEIIPIVNKLELSQID